jgi:excisionase family DNA binding protein
MRDNELNGLSLDGLVRRIPSLDREQLLALRVRAAALYGATGAALGAITAIDQALSSDTPASARSSTEPDGDRGLTADQVALRLGFTVDYVYRHKGEFPFARKVGTRWRFSERGLTEYLAKGGKQD